MHVNHPQAQMSLITAAYSLKHHDKEVAVHLAIQTQRRLAAFLEGPALSGPASSAAPQLDVGRCMSGINLTDGRATGWRYCRLDSCPARNVVHLPPPTLPPSDICPLGHLPRTFSTFHRRHLLTDLTSILTNPPLHSTSTIKGNRHGLHLRRQ